MELLRTYTFATVATLAIWLGALFLGGWSALFTVMVLTALEVTFSADNAVVNSKVLATMSKEWRFAFLTIGIVFAVFGIRFILPILLVMLAARLNFSDVLQLAFNNPHVYATYLEKASTYINAFGGAFLLLIALSYFIDFQRKTYWLGWLERHLGKLGRYDNITTFIMLLGSLLLYVTAQTDKTTVLIASIFALTLHTGLSIMEDVFKKHYGRSALALKRGFAGLTAFIYLEVLDASFSLDGVIGAFALTGSVLLIVAGLGAGAVWVRSMTVHLVKAKALDRYIYLEQGAHWAIAFLGSVMWLRLYNIQLPEVIVGLGGLLVIVLALIASRPYRRIQS